jgi:hypothetical protein
LTDFGSGAWRHEVAVETIERVPMVLKFATCIDGHEPVLPRTEVGPATRRVRGVGRHPFDPEAFSVAAINAALQRVR